MRTLKKALSLVLVLAMVFTLAVPALAVDKASEFKDYAKVQNKEAVDVLTAIGVINGNADGTFGADAKFTRAQGATMIAYLTLGKTVADALPTSATKFSDVPANFWGAKYIQYCANEGIINGYGNGKFGPDDELTSAQWALMLLGALGYSSKNEGIGGTGWEIAATRLAMKAGVASADDMVGTMTRDTAAKMAFNTLKADLVEYQSNGTNITVGDTNINVGATKAETVTSKADYADNFGDAPDSTGARVVQFGEQHFPKLTLSNANSKDAQGRPATEWKLGTEVIANGAKTPAHTFVATKNATYTDAASYSKYLNDTLKITSNSSKLVYTDADDTFINNDTKETSYSAAQIKAGDIVEVYVNSDNATDVEDVVVTRYAALKVTAIRDLTASQIKNNASNADEDIVNATQRITLSDNSVIYDTKFAGFDYAVGDNVLVAKKGSEVLASKAADTVTGVVTRVNNSARTIVVDGETYTLAGDINVEAKKGDQTFVVADGFVWGASETVSKDYVMVLDVSARLSDSGFTNEYYFNVRYVNKNGEVAVDKIYTPNNSDPATVEKNKFYLVSEDGDHAGMKKFSATNVTTASGALLNNTLSKTQPYFANGVYADSKTVFVLKTDKNTYKSYTGIANVPGYTGSATAYWVANSSSVAEVVYIDVTNSTASSTEAKDLVYFLSSTKAGTGYDATNNVNYDIYNAIVDGEKTTVNVHSGATVVAGLVTVDSYDANGYVNTVSTVNGKGGYAVHTVNTTTDYYAPSLIIQGTGVLFLADDAAIYTIDADKNVSAVGAADLIGSVNGTFYVVYKSATDKTVTAVYFEGTIA